MYDFLLTAVEDLDWHCSPDSSLRSDGIGGINQFSSATMTLWIRWYGMWLALLSSAQGWRARKALPGSPDPTPQSPLPRLLTQRTITSMTSTIQYNYSSSSPVSATTATPIVKGTPHHNLIVQPLIKPRDFAMLPSVPGSETPSATDSPSTRPPAEPQAYQQVYPATCHLFHLHHHINNNSSNNNTLLLLPLCHLQQCSLCRTQDHRP